MLKETLLNVLNMQSKTVNNAIITLGDTDDSGKGRHFKSRFIQPGVAGYPGQFGNVLITKESFDKFIKSMVGVPVIINHKDVTDKNADDLRVGVVNSVWYDNKDGWYWCDGIIWDETAINLINDKNWSVSCSYNVTKADNEGGSENNIKYDMEFLDGVFTHLALVDNPRYERANIVFNSKTEILNDKWITVKPNGEDEKGRHLLIKDGEDIGDAMRRQWGVDVKGQQHLFDRKKYKTDTNYKEELHKKLQEHLKDVKKKYDNLEYLGVAEPDKLKDEDYEDISFEEWEDKQKDNKETYYEEDNEEYYTDIYADSIKKDFEEFMKSKKEESKQEEPQESELDQKREAYLATVKKMNDASKRRWHPKDGKEEKKSTFKPVKGIMQSLKDDYEAGKISAKEVAKELSKANLTPYLLDDNEALEKIGVKQSDSKGEKEHEDIKEMLKKVRPDLHFNYNKNSKYPYEIKYREGKRFNLNDIATSSDKKEDIYEYLRQQTKQGSDIEKELTAKIKETKENKNTETTEPKKYNYTLTKREVEDRKMLGGMADTGNYYTNGDFAIDKRYLNIKGQEPTKKEEIEKTLKLTLKGASTYRHTPVKDFEIGELKREYGKPIKVAKYSYYDEKYGYERNIYLNKKYNDLFKNFDLKFGGETEPVFAYKGKDIVGVVMPIQAREQTYSKVENGLDEEEINNENQLKLKINNSNIIFNRLEDTFYEALAEVIVEHIEG